MQAGAFFRRPPRARRGEQNEPGKHLRSPVNAYEKKSCAKRPGVRRIDAALFLLYSHIMNQWPHAPVHILDEQGAYMVTCGTYKKAHYLNTPDRLCFFQSALFLFAEEFGWRLQAWAVLSNHYHFVAFSPGNPKSMGVMLSKLHTLSAAEINRQDHKEGRKVWCQYYDSHITYQTSFLARLRYVHQNPVHHGLVSNAESYPWCSASWLAQTASSSFVKTLQGFGTTRLNVRDDFDIAAPVDNAKGGFQQGGVPVRRDIVPQRGAHVQAAALQGRMRAGRRNIGGLI